MAGAAKRRRKQKMAASKSRLLATVDENVIVIPVEAKKTAVVEEHRSTPKIVEEKSLVPKVDVLPFSQSIYEAAKNIWAFGSNIPLLNLWMGASYTVARAVVGISGNDLEAVDHGLHTKLAEFDYHLSKFLGRVASE
jgi:hypothetical protein